MSTRILPLLALLPFAACTVTEAGLDAPPRRAPAVTQVSVPVPRPAAIVTAPAPSSAPTSAALPARPSANPLAAPPAAEGIAAAEPTPAAAPGPAPTGRLGTTVASLGTTDPGLWLETPLVAAPTRGRIEYQGQSVNVELRPSGGEPGSGSQISLEAMRALGAPLTGLPELTVYGG